MSIIERIEGPWYGVSLEELQVIILEHSKCRLDSFQVERINGSYIATAKFGKEFDSFMGRMVSDIVTVKMLCIEAKDEIIRKNLIARNLKLRELVSSDFLLGFISSVHCGENPTVEMESMEQLVLTIDQFDGDLIKFDEVCGNIRSERQYGALLSAEITRLEDVVYKKNRISKSVVEQLVDARISFIGMERSVAYIDVLRDFEISREPKTKNRSGVTREEDFSSKEEAMNHGGSHEVNSKRHKPDGAAPH